MSLVCSEILKLIEESYPLKLAEEYDNVGLLIGSINKEINRSLVCLEITDEVVEEAIKLGVDMIVSHHPIIFSPLKKISEENPDSKLLIKLIRKDINVYSLHTNFDNSPKGMSDLIAAKLGLNDIAILSQNRNIKLYKLVIYVPESHAERVRMEMLNLGGGHIGNYSHCSFNLNGTGTFMPLEGTNPFIGSKGEIEKVNEVRIESIVTEFNRYKVLQGAIAAHPYEEAAYDIIPLENTIANGAGRIGKLSSPMKFNEFCKYVKEKLNLSAVSAVGDMNRNISRVGIIGGSGDDFIFDAFRSGCDVLLTGDIKHHEAHYALSLKLNIIDAGHYGTEALFSDYIADFIASKCNIECFVSKVDTNPFRVF